MQLCEICRFYVQNEGECAALRLRSKSIGHCGDLMPVESLQYINGKFLRDMAARFEMGERKSDGSSHELSKEDKYGCAVADACNAMARAWKVN